MDALKITVHGSEHTGGLPLVILGRVSQDGLLGNAVEPIGNVPQDLPFAGRQAPVLGVNGR